MVAHSVVLQLTSEAGQMQIAAPTAKIKLTGLDRKLQ